jgi:hypothetical protein
MKESIPSTPFASAILTGLFLGIAATLICFGYTVGYEMITGTNHTFMSSVSFLIFACTLAVFCSSIFFFYLQRWVPRGELIFVIVFALLTAFGLWRVDIIQHATLHWLTGQTKGLLTGIILIVGLCAFAGVPLLYHNRGFQNTFI